MIIFILTIITLIVNNQTIELFIILIKNLFYFLNNNDVSIICGFLPIKIYDNLTNHENFRSDLHKVGGVYGIVNVSAKSSKKIKQYIGSSKDLYQRLMDHIRGQDSNIRLQRSISKYGIENFKIYIYYFHTDPLVKLTDIETEVIKSFPFDSLYNFKKEAISMLGYIHTIKAIKKMKLRYKDKTNHPMFGKKHDSFALSKIRKPGKLNPMFGKTHSIETKLKMSLSKSKLPVGLYDTNNNLIKTFSNQVELSKYLKLNKSTIGRYLKSKKLILNKYYIRTINNEN